MVWGERGWGRNHRDVGLVCAQLKRPWHVERRMLMKSRGGSLLGEEMRLRNVKGHYSVQCLSIRDGCWMVTRGLEGSHS